MGKSSRRINPYSSIGVRGKRRNGESVKRRNGESVLIMVGEGWDI